jgi:putative endonuclease
MKTYYVYILASKKNGTLYIGFTDDLTRRVIEHKLKSAPGFTAKYGVDKLVYFEEFNNSFAAFQRERQLKKWHRAWKIELIEKNNPLWNDLASDWCD